MEELKIENVRLQTLVDVLDSQPELVFCITACGDLTYISERTVNFINVDGADTDEDPSHISQILAPDSVDSVLKTIREIMRISPPKSALSESSMLFSAKVRLIHSWFSFHFIITTFVCEFLGGKIPRCLWKPTGRLTSLCQSQPTPCYRRCCAG